MDTMAALFGAKFLQQQLLALFSAILCWSIVDASLVFQCNPSMVGARVDPIISPGVLSSHDHTFFGSTGISPHLPPGRAGGDFLASHNTTCEGDDRSVYWFPTVYWQYASGQTVALQPAALRAYWLNSLRGTNNYRPIDPFPVGLRLFWGTPSACTYDEAAKIPGTPTPSYHISCNGAVTAPDTPYVWPSRRCPVVLGNVALRIDMQFPECWNGVDLDSPDHISHMAWASISGDCPPTHPRRLWALRVEVTYRIADDMIWGDANGPPRFRLGHQMLRQPYGVHGDFICGIPEARQRTLMTNIIPDANRIFNPVATDGAIASYIQPGETVAYSPTAQPPITTTPIIPTSSDTSLRDAHYGFLGCWAMPHYSEIENLWVMPIIKNSVASTWECYRIAHSKGFRYFAVLLDKVCRGTNQWPQPGRSLGRMDDKFCRMPCTPSNPNTGSFNAAQLLPYPECGRGRFFFNPADPSSLSDYRAIYAVTARATASVGATNTITKTCL